MAKIISLITKHKLLIVILVIAGFFRLWKISEVPVSLFSDELDVGYQAYSITKTGKDYVGNPWPLYFQSYADFRAPVYIYSAVPTIALFGITQLGVRLPAIIFGVLGVLAIYLLSNELVSKKFGFWNLDFGILPAIVLAISPWHLQYSRAAFEVTELLFFLMMGLYFFFKSVNTSHPEFSSGSKKEMLKQVQHDNNSKWLPYSAVCFGLTPWIYSTAKLFTPALLIFLVIVFRKEIFSISKKNIIYALITLGIFAIPMVYTIFSGSGGQRFSYISIFTDPTTNGEVASLRLIDAQVEGGVNRNVLQKVSTRLIHNKYFYWGSKITNNYFETFSSQFLFVKGDLNLRHSPEGIGQFYKVEALMLILGAALFFVFFKDRKIKLLIAFWILFGVVPSAITRDGGHHATRLILILPPLVILISYGIVQSISLFSNHWKKYLALIYFGFWILSFGFYLHTYYIHNPWYSERDWHAGYKEVIQSIKEMEGSYDKIIITNALDQPYIFFASYYPYPPKEWQKGFEEEYVEGFGKLKHINKFYFGQVGEEGIESLQAVLEEKTLYIAAQRELGENLIMEPTKTPEGLDLVKAISYPSGEPAFYLFERGEK